MNKQEIKVPKERIAVIIGKDGETKKILETNGDVKLTIDSKEGDVLIESENSVSAFEMKSVIKAIGRGFSPETALLLLNESYSFEVMDIVEYTGKSKNKMLRMKGRVIGSDGKSREHIEGLTGTHISVYGRTIGIIGEIEDVAMARVAIDMLLSGSPHLNVYRWLEDKKRSLMRHKLHNERADF